jgi:hypothetical protein
MTISHTVVNSIMCLEDIVRDRWVHLVLFLCPDESQCQYAARVLRSLDYVVETLVMEDIRGERGAFYSSIERLKKGMSKVLVTTEEVIGLIQNSNQTKLMFDVVL